MTGLLFLVLLLLGTLTKNKFAFDIYHQSRTSCSGEPACICDSRSYRSDQSPLPYWISNFIKTLLSLYGSINRGKVSYEAFGLNDSVITFACSDPL